MNSEDMTFIVAGNYEEAVGFVRQNGIKSSQWRNVSYPDQLRGIRDHRILFCGNWKNRKDINYIYDMADSQGHFIEYPEGFEIESTPKENRFFTLMEGNAVSTALDPDQSMQYVQAELICCLCKKPVERVMFEENYETMDWLFTIYCHGRAERNNLTQQKMLKSKVGPTELLRRFLKYYQPFKEDAARLNGMPEEIKNEKRRIELNRLIKAQERKMRPLPLKIDGPPYTQKPPKQETEMEKVQKLIQLNQSGAMSNSEFKEAVMRSDLFAAENELNPKRKPETKSNSDMVDAMGFSFLKELTKFGINPGKTLKKVTDKISDKKEVKKQRSIDL